MDGFDHLIWFIASAVVTVTVLVTVLVTGTLASEGIIPRRHHAEHHPLAMLRARPRWHGARRIRRTRRTVTPPDRRRPQARGSRSGCIPGDHGGTGTGS
jgi:hypothetical protein